MKHEYEVKAVFWLNGRHEPGDKILLTREQAANLVRMGKVGATVGATGMSPARGKKEKEA